MQLEELLLPPPIHTMVNLPLHRTRRSGVHVDEDIHERAVDLTSGVHLILHDQKGNKNIVTRWYANVEEGKTSMKEQLTSQVVFKILQLRA